MRILEGKLVANLIMNRRVKVIRDSQFQENGW